jgi:hypothetical protein
MRRRVDDSVPPDALLVFDGRDATSADVWEAWFEEWHEARRRWEAAHPSAGALPERVVGGCPLDWESIGIPPGFEVRDRLVLRRAPNRSHRGRTVRGCGGS